MRFRPQGSSRTGRALAIEITSMIDVVFLLIVFFMTTAHFAQQQRAPLELPQERGAQMTPAPAVGLVINLLQSGAIEVGRVPVSEDDLRERVAAHLEAAENGGESAVTVRTDRRTDSRFLNGLVRELGELGVGSVQVATEAP